MVVFLVTLLLFAFLQLFPVPLSNSHASSQVSLNFTPSSVFNTCSDIITLKAHKNISCPQTKIRQMLRSVQDSLGLRVPGVYKLPCACEAYYIRQTGQSVSVRQKEHQSHLRPGHVDKSILTKDGWATGLSIRFDQTEILLQIRPVGAPEQLGNL